jgi:perosamine synthetase
MSKLIPLSVPSIKGNEWKYVKECLDTEWVSSAGRYVNLFEEKIVEYTGAKYAVATVNGTAALHIALIIAGVKADDEIIVPSLTFIAPINAIKYVNANPIFIDSDEFYNIDSEKTIEFIRNETFFKDDFTFNKKTGKRISVIIPVHIFGNAVWLDELVPLCRERNIRIIEDSTESLGTRYTKGNFSGKHTGTIGDFGTISFNGNKIITTGGGGMILTDNIVYANKAKYLTTQAKDDEVRYIHNEVGYNYRMINVLAAIGVAQLERLDEYIEIKKENYLTYKDAIKNINGLTLANVPDYANSNYWMYGLQLEERIYPFDKEGLMEKLSCNKIQSRPIWYPNHLQKPFVDCQNYKIENTLMLVKKTLNIPCSVNIIKDEIDFVIENLM